MSRFFCAHEITKPEDVIPYLAKQERHWKQGYSAYEPIPGSTLTTFRLRFALHWTPARTTRVLFEGLFERNADLRTTGRRSQTDLLAFIRCVHRNAVIAVGGVDEPFGDLVSIWNDCSPGRERCLQSLCTSLGLRVADIGNIRYQLLH